MKISTATGQSLDAVAISGRVVVAQQVIICPITTGVTLASLCTGAIIPAGAVAVEIMADGGAIRLSLKQGQLATVAIGMPLADQTSRVIDSNLASVSVISGAAAAVNAQVIFYDRV
jgi:hypothetical protein